VNSVVSSLEWPTPSVITSSRVSVVSASDRDREPDSRRHVLLRKLKESGSLPADEAFRRIGSRRPMREALGARRAKRSVERMMRAAVIDGRLSPIAYQRMRSGLSQSQLAESLGIHQSQIARWESPGQFEKIAIGNARRLAAALKVNVRDLFLD
jgi:ribosome-binding protein aMBF1 (putative translation factor)